jgi:murein DD-endopeptidase MepM/ murein hydrolase activator NlpD
MNLFDKKKWENLLKKYHVAIYSSDSNETLRNFHVSKPTIIILIVFIFIVYSVFGYFFIKLTPLSKYMGRSESDSKRVSILEDKVKKISNEMSRLQEYTDHLRYALGDTSVKKNDLNPSALISKEFSKIKNDEFLFDSPNGDTRQVPYNGNDNSINLPFMTPVSNYVISQEFDEEKSHFGIDFAGKTGEPILAAADGYVIFNDWTNDYGNTLIIMHSSKFITVYKHNSSNIKNTGNYVRKGEIIALLGNTGKLSSSPHLHFEIWKNGLAKNPLKYLLIKK